MIKIQCTSCNSAFPKDTFPFRCERCGGVYDFELLPIFHKDAIYKDRPGIWCYRSQFGLPESAPEITLGEGSTPLIWVNYFGKPLALKLDHLNPTGSFKDRGSAILASLLVNRGVKFAVEDSSGNAGSSFAAYAARSGIKARIYVPESTSGPKISQIEAYDAEVVRVIGPRSKAASAVREAAEEGNVYASHAYLPHGIIGYATLAYELWDQLDLEPGTVVCPVGQGNLFLGIGRGFEALLNAGMISRIPKMVGVQSQAFAPVWAMYKYGTNGIKTEPEEETIAEGIRIKAPIRANAILDFLRNRNGMMVVVDDENILNSYRALARFGVFVEPTSAVVYAAMKQLVDNIPEPIVLIMTGSGLKVQLDS
jgi:threonine synthase